MIDHSDDTGERYYDEDEHGTGLRERLEGLIPSVIRRTMSTGAGARQYTEDVIRGAIGDLKLPKEAVTYLVEIADNTKKEVVRVAAREFREFLDSARFNEELSKILTQLSFEIRTEIRFIPNDQALRPSVSTEARVKAGGEKAIDAGAETTEKINDAVRSNATELVEMLLGRVLRGKTDEVATVATPPEPPAQPPSPEPAPTPKKRAPRKRTTKPRSPRET